MRPRKFKLVTRYVTIEIRTKVGHRRTGANPTPPDDERCSVTTAKGNRCTRSVERWGDTTCFQHRPKSRLAQIVVTDSESELPDDPAEWLASLSTE